MVEKMKLVRVQGTLPQLNDFLDACCMDGRFDLEPATRYMSDSLGYAALNEENPYPATRDQIETMAKEAGVELHEEQRHTDPPDDEAKAYLSDLLEQIDDLCAERQGLLDQQKLCEDGIAQYSHFLNLKVNVDELLDCQHVKVRFGFLPTEGYNKLMSNYADDPYILFVECTQTKTGHWGIYLTPREKALETDGIFSMLYFEPVRVPGAAGSPAEIIEHFKENLEVVKKAVDEVNARIAALWHDHEAKVQMLYDTVRYYAAIYDLRRMAAVKGSHFFCVGWVPAAEVEEIAGKARAIKDLRVTVDGPEAAGKMTPPTKLKNPWWSRPFEFFVEMYGLPAYGETDVTGFVALTFTVLFGMMFGDVGQGIVLALFSTFMWKVKHNDLFHLMIPCGISSTIFGLVYGSLFGYEEALDPLYHAIGMAGKPVSVMDSITGILMVAVYIGIVLVLAAMALNMYTHARHKEWGEFIFSPNGLVGMVTYLCGVDLASAYMGAVTFLPQVVAIIGMVVGLILLLFAELLAPMVEGKPWQPAGGMGNYLMQSVFELLETVLSYLSNTISFLRVGAFVIVHASMMMVVFTLAGTPNNIVVVILGNIVVICLEALLSAIQGIRLEFYEMFSRCYKGGGRKFVAFDLKKENA
ncbi:V-type ATP synthase subunit I [Gemmiger sp.]|uniref:V-type ATP synthase subunit I n=1 Tax=Gemmiger sp. TaxID=2049027 RepID=UPI003A92B6DE